MHNFFKLVLAFSFLYGCNSTTKEFAENAQIAGKESALASVDATKQYEAQMSQEMERDLARRYRFFDSLRGDYKGDLIAENLTLKTKLILVPQLVELFQTPRVRRVNEVLNDLAKLQFKAQIVQTDSSGATFGCIFENVVPDLERGMIQLISEKCVNTYVIWLEDGESELARVENSHQLSQDILDSPNLTQISRLVVKMIPTKTQDEFLFTVTKKN